MIKNKVAIEIEKSEKLYQFLCEAASTAGEIYDVLTEMRGKIINIIQEQQASENKVKNPDAEVEKTS